MAAKNSTKSPVAVDAPVDAPVETPVETPIDAPVEAPIETPVETPIDAPVDAPVEAPIETPVESDGSHFDSLALTVSKDQASAAFAAAVAVAESPARNTVYSTPLGGLAVIEPAFIDRVAGNTVNANVIDARPGFQWAPKQVANMVGGSKFSAECDDGQLRGFRYLAFVDGNGGDRLILATPVPLAEAIKRSGRAAASRSAVSI